MDYDDILKTAIDELIERGLLQQRKEMPNVDDLIKKACRVQPEGVGMHCHIG